MNRVAWFKPKPPEPPDPPATTKELQAELYALVLRILADGDATCDRMDRYERLLCELYKREEKPCAILQPGEGSK